MLKKSIYIACAYSCSECLCKHDRKNYCRPCQPQQINLNVVQILFGLNSVFILPLTLTGSSKKRISTPGVRSGQSQILTALSSPDEARNRPSGEHRKLDIWPPWASAVNVCTLWSRKDESGIRSRVPLEHALHSETHISAIVLTIVLTFKNVHSYIFERINFNC